MAGDSEWWQLEYDEIVSLSIDQVALQMLRGAVCEYTHVTLGRF
jgi:hypothetical protein